MKSKKYTCVCCGHRVFSVLFNFEICSVCGWEDDPLQIRFPMEKGANKVSLVEAQINLIKMGVIYKGFLNFGSGEKFEKDTGWRMLDKQDKFHRKDKQVNEIDYPMDMATLYYWKDDYWL